MTEADKPKKHRRSETERFAAELSDLDLKIKAAELRVATLKTNRDHLKAAQKARAEAILAAVAKA